MLSLLALSGRYTQGFCIRYHWIRSTCPVLPLRPSSLYIHRIQLCLFVSIRPHDYLGPVRFVFLVLPHTHTLMTQFFVLSLFHCISLSLFCFPGLCMFCRGAVWRFEILSPYSFLSISPRSSDFLPSRGIRYFVTGTFHSLSTYSHAKNLRIIGRNMYRQDTEKLGGQSTTPSDTGQIGPDTNNVHIWHLNTWVVQPHVNNYTNA